MGHLEPQLQPQTHDQSTILSPPEPSKGPCQLGRTWEGGRRNPSTGLAGCYGLNHGPYSQVSCVEALSPSAMYLEVGPSEGD